MIFWLPLACIALHITEEFVWPGGFADWDRAYRPAFASSITPRFHVVMNSLLVLVAAQIGFLAGTRPGVALWLTVAALVAGNGVWHLIGTWRTKRYSPGLVTGLALYAPLAIYGLTHFVASGEATAGTAVVAAALGGSYHLWAAAMHRRRTANPTA